MRPRTRSRRLVAGVLVICLAHGGLAIAPATARDNSDVASLRSNIFLQDERSPAKGAILIALNAGTGAAHWSRPAAADGVCRLDGLPPGTYDVAVEVDRNIYVAESPLRLQRAEARVRLAIKPGVQPERPVPQLPPAAGTARYLDLDAPAAAAKGKLPSRAGRAGLALALASLATVVAIAAAGGSDGDNDADPAPVSPSQP